VVLNLIPQAMDAQEKIRSTKDQAQSSKHKAQNALPEFFSDNCHERPLYHEREKRNELMIDLAFELRYFR